MYDLEYFDKFLNQLDLECLNSINLEIDNYNNSFKNVEYLKIEQELTIADNTELTTADNIALSIADNTELTNADNIDLSIADNTELTNADNTDFRTTSKKRIRQIKINSASRKCRKKQKIKTKLMESYITQVHGNIKKLFTSLDNLNMQEVISMVYQMNGDMNDYSKNIIKEVNKI